MKIGNSMQKESHTSIRSSIVTQVVMSTYKCNVTVINFIDLLLWESVSNSVNSARL